MRVLFASTRGTGHLTPLLPLARACADAGHEPVIAGPPDLEEAVAAAGHPYWPVEPPAEDVLGKVWARVPTLPRDEGSATVVADIFATLNVQAALPRMAEACREWRPDLVVRDPNEYASALAAEQQGITCVRVGIGLCSSEEEGLELAAAPLHARRVELGLAPDRDASLLRASPYLTPFPASLEDPDFPDQPDTTRFRDPGWDSQAGALPDWWDGNTDPLVYVTFGSVAGSFEQSMELYLGALAGLAPLPVRVLLTVGRKPDVEAIRAQAPANAHVEAWVPQGEVLPHAAAVVCHMGSGSTLGALAHGLPLVAVPLFADQPANAARVEAVGAGVSVPPDPEAMRGAVERVLADGSFAAGAGALAAEMRTHVPLGDVMERLLA